MAGFWRTLNTFSAGLFTVTLIRGPGARITDPEYLTHPRAWHDQRGIPGATAPEQPQSIDYTDLYAMGWTPRRDHRS
jgi:hypothetical protein